MCGIFGIWQSAQKPVELQQVQNATTLLRHRGPDDEGYLLVNTGRGQVVPCGGRETDARLALPLLENQTERTFDLAFGFRRLAILDLSPAGHQPMSSADGRYWIIFNGELYNYVELRAELAALGYVFRSGSDTEVILNAYAQWGAAMLGRFVGMFALVILDCQGKQLFLARDFFGIKPLYYTIAGGQFAFASEIKALLDLPAVSRRANPQRLYDYLRFGLTDHGAATMFADIHQLPAAHLLEVDLQGNKIGNPQRYWHLAIDRSLTISGDEAARRTRELFLENVRLHLRSDVPVGSCLSGGIDSSSIVMAMRQLEGSTLALHTFSAIFEDKTIGEERYVDVVTGAAASTVHKTYPSAAELLADLDHLISIQEEPFGSTSLYAQQRVFRLAAEAGIKVMLDGQGADELLGGYRPAINFRLAALVKGGHWAAAWRLFQTAAALPGNSSKTIFNGVRSLLVPESLRIYSQNLVGKEQMPAWLNQRWFSTQNVVFHHPMSIGPQHDIFRQYLYDATTYRSLPMLLRYEDRNSMSHSIESRVPFLTPLFAQFLFDLPGEYVISNMAETKAIFRSAMRGLTPSAILARKDKIGFATPEQYWLKTLQSWADETLRDADQAQIPVLNLTAVLREWEQVMSGACPFDGRVWRWLNLIRWLDLYQVECE